MEAYAREEFEWERGGRNGKLVRYLFGMGGRSVRGLGIGRGRAEREVKGVGGVVGEGAGGEHN